MDVSRVRYVTRRYSRLQGLRLIPLGMVFLVSGSWRAGWLPGASAHHAAASAWFFGGVAIAIGLSFLIREWYASRYGRVSQDLWRSGLLAQVGFVTGWLVANWLQEQWQWLYPLPALFVGLALFVVGVADWGIRKHYIVIAALWFAVGSLGMLDVPLRIGDVVLDLTIGVTLILAGFGDHWVLRNSLQPATL